MNSVMRSEKPASSDFKINGPERIGDLHLVSATATGTGACHVCKEWSNDQKVKFKDAISRQPKRGYNYKKLFNKWRDHLPLGKKIRDLKKDLMLIFPEQFKGIRKMPGQYKIKLKEGATPVHLSNRNVPEALWKSLKEVLDRTVCLRVIAKVTKPTDWCHNLIYVVKNDKSLRICLDLCNLSHWTCLKKYFCLSNKDILLTL